MEIINDSVTAYGARRAPLQFTKGSLVQLTPKGVERIVGPFSSISFVRLLDIFMNTPMLLLKDPVISSKFSDNPTFEVCDIQGLLGDSIVKFRFSLTSPLLEKYHLEDLLKILRPGS